MGEGHHALGLRETKRVRVGASIVFVVASLTVVAIGAGGTFPDGVGGMKLFAKTTVVREWEGSSGTTGRHLFIVVLGHGVPLKTVVASVFYGCSYSYSPSAHSFWPVMIRNKGAVVKIWMNA